MAPPQVCGVMEKTHPYKEGDLVYDLKHRETFAFSEEFDGYRARMFPELLRKATAEERVAYEQKRRTLSAELDNGSGEQAGVVAKTAV